jgi:hypothetical protein
MIMVSSACVDVGGNTYLLALRPVTTGKPSGRAFCKVDEKIGWGLSVVNKMEANPLVFVAGGDWQSDGYVRRHMRGTGFRCRS